jgi:hypothetical protein
MVARKQLEFEILVKMLGLSFSENWREQAKRFWAVIPQKRTCAALADVRFGSLADI